MKGLTQKQLRVLKTIHEFTREKGYPPTVREIGERVGLRSSCTVYRHIQALMTKGALKAREGRKARTLELTGQAPLSPRVSLPWHHIPLVGRVAAGEPLLAEQNIEEYVDIPREWSPDIDLFILRVKGDSMIEAGILDGDSLVVRRQQTADNGDIVVAMTEESDATVKYFHKERGRIRLQPANSSMEPIYLKEAQILGKAIACYRKL